MKNYLVVLAVLVSVFAVSCDKDDVNEGDVVELLPDNEGDIYTVDKTKIKRPGSQND